MKRITAFLFFLSLSFYSTSQESMVDSAITIPYIGISYAFHQPAGDLNNRFGIIQSVGGQFGVKLKSNILIALKMEYMFGSQVKEDDILDNIRTSEGGIIELGGELTDPILDMQGFNASLLLGYIFPIIGPNPNSGLLVAAGPCFFQHRILIDYRDATIPQIEGEYLKGYDRLSSGFGLNEFIGYIHYGRKKLVNFYAGFDFTQSWTTSKRGFNYDEGRADNQKRNDNLVGIRFGWVLTLYKRAPEQFYYR